MYINNKNFSPKRFSSGELKLIKDYLLSFVNSHKEVNILYNNDIISIFELQVIVNFYIENKVKVNLTLSYLPYQRMNHNDLPEVETIKYVANIFNSLKLNSLKICEPHCNLEYFNNSKKICLVEKIFNKVKKNINFDETKDIFVFTDKGSMEKYKHLGKNHIYCKKQRDKQTGLVSSYELFGKIEKNQKIIIIDDIISSGDTIIECLNKIKEYSNQKVSIICGHFEKNKYNTRLFSEKQVEKIFSSNSLRKRGNIKLKLFDVKELIYE